MGGIIYFIILIILLVLTALLISINLKLYRINNGIKRGGEVSDKLLDNIYDNYKTLSDTQRTLFTKYLFNIGITNDDKFLDTPHRENLLNLWLHEEGSAGTRIEWSNRGKDSDLQNAIIASIKDKQSIKKEDLYEKIYDSWLGSSTLLYRSGEQLKENIQIKIIFPNFFNDIISISIDINNGFNIPLGFFSNTDIESISIADLYIYFDIKQIIWQYCAERSLIEFDNESNRNLFFHDTILDACDLNGWSIQSFVSGMVGNGLYEFINCQRSNMEKIIFVLRGTGNTSFVKAVIFGRKQISRESEEDNALIDNSYYGSRQILGDGNCYYTAFIFNLLEFALFANTVIRERIKYNILRALASVKSTMSENGIRIYNRENDEISIISKEDMYKLYNSMLEKLEIFLSSEHYSIFMLEG
jgi:hypothetical protein